MRHFLLLPLLLACTAAPAAAEPALNPASASILLHLHPRPWHPPAAVVRAGLRTDVDPGPEGLGAAADEAYAAIREARTRALANVRLEMRPDGSGRAVVGGLLRSYALARIGPGGRIVEDCAQSEAEALERLGAPAPARIGPASGHETGPEVKKEGR
jgi:hypothetical protein